MSDSRMDQRMSGDALIREFFTGAKTTAPRRRGGQAMAVRLPAGAARAAAAARPEGHRHCMQRWADVWRIGPAISDHIVQQ